MSTSWSHLCEDSFLDKTIWAIGGWGESDNGSFCHVLMKPCLSDVSIVTKWCSLFCSCSQICWHNKTKSKMHAKSRDSFKTLWGRVLNIRKIVSEFFLVKQTVPWLRGKFQFLFCVNAESPTAPQFQILSCFWVSPSNAPLQKGASLQPSFSSAFKKLFKINWMSTRKKWFYHGGITPSRRPSHMWQQREATSFNSKATQQPRQNERLRACMCLLHWSCTRWKECT